MKKTLLIVGALLALASTAMAGGVNLSWTDCGSFGAQNRTFACASNSGSNVLVCSFMPSQSWADAVGIDARIDLQSADATTLNAWWQMFNAGSCRGTAVPTANVINAATNCAEFFNGAGAGGITAYNITGNRAALSIAWAVPDPVAVDNTTEYYGVNVSISNSKSTGTGSCAGCLTPVCLVLNVIGVAYGPNATLQDKLEAPITRNFATWQGGVVTGGCPGATPTQSKTWGQVKSLYR